jgi:hypothetical protein
MENIVLTARHLVDNLLQREPGDRRSLTDRERLSAHVITQLLELVEYSAEQDKINERRIAVLRDLNAKYREHVLTLISVNDNLKADILDLTESNFGKLQ